MTPFLFKVKFTEYERGWGSKIIDVEEHAPDYYVMAEPVNFTLNC